jgi:hypothetical protein
MLRGSLSQLMVLVAVSGCPGSGRLGEFCGGNDDCDGALQCLNNSCAPLCGRAPDCGDGYSCDEQGYCLAATNNPGDPCKSQVDCPAGQSCQLSGVVDDNIALASCTDEKAMTVSGDTCSNDSECRHGTCALGHCADLCQQTLDCAGGNSCVTIPHLLAPGATFSGCLPTDGVVTWSIPMNSPSAEILLPVPNVAGSAALVMSVDDLGQKVGATGVLDPDGNRLYRLPCSTQSPSDACNPVDATDGYFDNQVRHLPALGQSVLMIPSGSSVQSEIKQGVYRVQVASLRASDAPGSAIPHVTAVVRLGRSHTLDLALHFFFLDLADHPCALLPEGDPLTAHTAQTARLFQDTYLGELRTVFSRAGLSLDTLTFADITDHPELDGIDVALVVADRHPGDRAQSRGGRARRHAPVRHRDRPRHAVLPRLVGRGAAHGARDRSLHGAVSQRRARVRSAHGLARSDRR